MRDESLIVRLRRGGRSALELDLRVPSGRRPPGGIEPAQPVGHRDRGRLALLHRRATASGGRSRVSAATIARTSRQGSSAGGLDFGPHSDQATRRTSGRCSASSPIGRPTGRTSVARPRRDRRPHAFADARRAVRRVGHALDRAGLEPAPTRPTPAEPARSMLRPLRPPGRGGRTQCRSTPTSCPPPAGDRAQRRRGDRRKCRTRRPARGARLLQLGRVRLSRVGDESPPTLPDRDCHLGRLGSRDAPTNTLGRSRPHARCLIQPPARPHSPARRLHAQLLPAGPRHVHRQLGAYRGRTW